MTAPEEPPQKPVRVTLSRRKGWRIPPNTVRVCRGTRWGNPWKAGEWSSTLGRVMSQADAAKRFADEIAEGGALSFIRRAARRELRGKNLACWCHPGAPCHADALLRVANESEQ